MVLDSSQLPLWSVNVTNLVYRLSLQLATSPLNPLEKSNNVSQIHTPQAIKHITKIRPFCHTTIAFLFLLATSLWTQNFWATKETQNGFCGKYRW
jgi:hypothetical protein